ncbi:SGNH/GDSL hydrolase family protein [Actinomadura barringtoniae]|uniref:SGNH/GDSL hydrolase family protein n=1 Tax=Actinomadura barringtoniae TaxID=1427535 RepID=A0A939PEU9_9ACTN|nr:SGNH/GDSL hydrolase family protein [Actinomadura barringtoniae]MBO2451365.1 SGNH/GDSL hydrolase family protein [Actinomadura barringtoniae]
MGASARAWVVACAILVAGCSTGSGGTGHEAARTVVALGDSVPEGANCNCEPYPQLSATALSVPGTRQVTATNDAVGGYTSADVLAQLRSKSKVAANVAGADAVDVEVGANDVSYDKSCGNSTACYEGQIPKLEQNLAEIVRRVHELTAGHQVLVVLLDYWSVWLGGQYAKEQGAAYVGAADEMTDQVNGIIKKTANDTGSAYVDLRAAFKGPDYAYDETRYLSDDGDHPNAAGHEQISAATVDVIDKTLHLGG